MKTRSEIDFLIARIRHNQIKSFINKEPSSEKIKCTKERIETFKMYEYSLQEAVESKEENARVACLHHFALAELYKHCSYTYRASVASDKNHKRVEAYCYHYMQALCELDKIKPVSKEEEPEIVMRKIDFMVIVKTVAGQALLKEESYWIKNNKESLPKSFIEYLSLTQQHDLTAEKEFKQNHSSTIKKISTALGGVLGLATIWATGGESIAYYALGLFGGMGLGNKGGNKAVATLSQQCTKKNNPCR